eukprot:XP_001698972.1 predicted protein [Chlamydomonas reinhardtii]
MNNYHIYEKIGFGKASTCYKGRKKKTISYYAIKSVDKTQKARVLQEVRTMHALDHRNILKFYAWYETTNHLWLILEYCVGGDLMSLLRQDVRLPESSVHDFARDLVTALQYLHSKEIIYCDLKPSNILLDENGRMKLGGFGLSRRLADINKKPLQALPQAMRGTPCYMAPELFSEGATHSTASDLWAVGCVLYECSMGRPPFLNSSLNQLIHEILNNEPQPITGASAEYQEMISRLLDKNPATRIKWRELCAHPFWQVRLPTLDLPPEPALEAFIARYNLAPTVEEMRQSTRDGLKLDKGRVMRQSTGPMVTDRDSASLEELIWHPSDTAVKPIVANRRIERLPDPRFDAASLPFKPWSLPEMLNANQADLEAFLTHIYRAIASAAPLKDKVNVLSYFETLCVDTNAANVLINSSLTILFIRMLRNARAPTLRIRLASVLGLLVRHATYIAEELASTGVVEVLSEALKDKNERVRRRVIATLGELLFYIATQQQDNAAAAAGNGGAPPADPTVVWGISSNTYAQVMRLLKDKEDEVAAHYAVKTVENICSQGGEWAQRFATQDVVLSLVQLINATGRSEQLRATAASTLARLLRHSPTLVAHTVDKYGIRLFPDLSTRARASLAEERGLLPGLIALMDHSMPLLRAKAVVTVMLLSRLSPRWLLEACKAKLIPAVERLTRDKDDYQSRALAALRAEAARLTPAICASITEELGGRGSAGGALCQQGELVLQHYAGVLNTLLPALCGVVSAEAEGGDTRFFCLRMVSDVLQTLLLDEELYGSAAQRAEGSAAGGNVGVAAAAIDCVLRSHILPLVPRLLRDEDPMPLYALKLLGGLLEINLSYVADVEAMGLAAQFFEFLSLEHSNNNVHNIRLCRQIIAAGSMPVAQLVQLQVAEKVAAVLEYATNNAVEPFLEPVLELVNTILQRDALEVSQNRSDGALAAVFLEQAGVLLDNCAHPDLPVSSSAASATSSLVALFPQQCAPWLLAPENATALATVLAGQHMLQQPGQQPGNSAAAVPPSLAQPLLEAVATALEVPGAAAPSEELVQLYESVRQSASASADAGVRSLAAEVAGSLGAVMH